MDQARLDLLLKRIGDVNDPDAVAPLVTLEEFFEGNDDGGSIWCNLSNAPAPDQVYKVLAAIRAQDDVHDVRILVTQWDGEGSWPFSDTVLFVTTADERAIQERLGEQYAADEIGPGPIKGAEPYGIPPGMSAIVAWWD